MAKPTKKTPVSNEFVQRLVKQFCQAPELRAMLTRLVDKELNSTINRCGIEFTPTGHIEVFDWTGDILFSQPLEKLLKERLKDAQRKTAADWDQTSSDLRRLAGLIDKQFGFERSEP